MKTTIPEQDATQILLDRLLLRRAGWLVKRARSYGSPAGVIETALHAFMEHPDPDVPRAPLTEKNTQMVRLDTELLRWVRAFARDQQLRQGRRISARAIIDDVLRTYLDAQDAMAPAVARRTTSIGLDRSLLQRARSYGGQADVIEAALRVFMEHPDPDVPRAPLTVRDIQPVRLDADLLLWVREFALNQQLRRGRQVTKRAIVEEILRADLDARDGASAIDGAPGAQDSPESAV